MSDADAKPKGGVPSWQMKQAPEAETAQKDEKPAAPAEDQSRIQLVENAKKFLEEDEVKDAATDKKIAFLESKGLNSKEIESLLGVTRNVEASSYTPPSPKVETPAQKTVAQAMAATSSNVSPPPPRPVSQPQRDTPPVVTYPEFLTTPVAPPPLITPTRVLNTLYAFGGLGALIYGASTYLVKPMSEALTSARHDLASTAQERLETFNEKLKPLVSTIPQPHLAHGEAYADRDDDSDSDSDPTELFHRDIGVQTSPDELENLAPKAEVKSVVEVQSGRAYSISQQLTEVDTVLASESHEAGNIQTEISSLKSYLDGLMYSAPTFNYGVGTNYGQKKDEDDEIGRVKKEIRAVKGVLLSARSFPGVGAVRR